MYHSSVPTIGGVSKYLYTHFPGLRESADCYVTEAHHYSKETVQVTVFLATVNRNKTSHKVTHKDT